MNLRSFLLTSALFWVSLPAQAAPTPEEKSLAKTLYQQASADMERGDYARACPQFEAAMQLDPEHIRTAMTLGMCEDHWGKLIKALGRFEHARQVASAQDAADKLKEIDDLMADLKRRIPKLRILVPQQLANDDSVQIRCDAQTVSKDAWGHEIAVDPGSHVIQASAADRASWRQEIRLQAGQTLDVTIGLSVKNDSPLNASSISMSPTRKLGFVGIGIGAASIIGGSIFGGLAISKNSASDNGHCTVDNRCDAVGTNLRYDAQAYGNASTALFVVGGVLLTGGIVLIAAAPSKDKQGTARETTIRIGLGTIQLQKTW